MSLGGVFIATALTLWAVEPSPAPLRTPAPPPSTIVGGEPTDPGEFGGVVAILAGQGLCTGTVVSPRVVVTAGHCLADIDDAEDIEVFYGDEVTSDNKVLIDSYGVHPQFCPDCDDEIFDYGYIVLAEEFPLPDEWLLPIVDQDEWDQTMGEGGTVVIVGYGEDPSVGDDNRGIGTKRSVATWISRITDNGYEFFAGGDQRDSCRGDSGGPAFVQLVNGQWRLAGIVSRGSNPCGDGGFYGVPYPALPWLRQETELDLCGGACGTCDCLDIAPFKSQGCSVDEPPRGRGALGLLALALLGLRRRYRL